MSPDDQLPHRVFLFLVLMLSLFSYFIDNRDYYKKICVIVISMTGRTLMTIPVRSALLMITSSNSHLDTYFYPSALGTVIVGSLVKRGVRCLLVIFACDS